jgi:hypothetical protein
LARYTLGQRRVRRNLIAKARRMLADGRIRVQDSLHGPGVRSVQLFEVFPDGGSRLLLDADLPPGDREGDGGWSS